MSPLTSMARSAHCPAGHPLWPTPSRQMCRGGGGAIPGDAALSAPGGPRYSRHLLPSPTGEGGLAHSWRRSSTHPSPLRGAWLSHSLALRVTRASVHVRACTWRVCWHPCVSTLACLCAPGAHTSTRTHVQEVRECPQQGLRHTWPYCGTWVERHVWWPFSVPWSTGAELPCVHACVCCGARRVCRRP